MLEINSKNDDGTTLLVDINDCGEVVLTTQSDRNPVPQFFVVKDGDLPSLHSTIKDFYIGYIEFIGGLLD